MTDVADLTARPAGDGRIAGVETRSPVVPILFGWLLAASWVLGSSHLIEGGLPLLGNDNTMRLVQIRDLLAGQGWFDLTQHRLGLEGGTPMHWSRVVDGPIALMILLLSPLLGEAGAETAAMTIWPLALLFAGIAAIVAMAQALGGRTAAWIAAFLAAAALAHSGKFTLGAIDHHNVQTVLFLWALAGAVLAQRSAAMAAVSGAAMATCLAIGVEAAPQLAAICLFMALGWAVMGEAWRAAAIRFAGALFGTLALLFLATAPASAYAGGYCDALSIDVALPFLAGAAGLLLAASLASRARLGARLAAFAAVGGGAVLAAVLVAPGCLGDPFEGMDPFLRENWLDRVEEAQPLSVGLMLKTGLMLPALVAAVLGIGAILRLLSNRENRHVWLLVLGILALSLAVMSVQIRGLVLVHPVAILPIALVAADLFVRSRETERLRPGLLSILLVVAATPYVWYIPADAATSPSRSEAAVAEDSDGDAATTFNHLLCLKPGALDALAALPPGLVSASSNLGSHVLRWTGHRVLSAPYHRNQAGMIAQLRIALGTEAEAERELRAHGVDYVASCPVDPEYDLPLDEHGGPFAVALARGEVPAFLEPIGTAPATGPGAEDGGLWRPIALYRVKPAE